MRTTDMNGRGTASVALGLLATAIILSATPQGLADTFAQSPYLSKFTQDLRGVGGSNGIPVAVKDGTRVWPGTVADHYTIQINQYTDTLHSALGPTTLWGYNPTKGLGVTGTPKQRHLGGILVVQKDQPVQITFRNNLPADHPLPVDTTIMGVMGNQNNRTATHLHGGLVPWISDGGPNAWWDPNGLSLIHI